MPFFGASTIGLGKKTRNVRRVEVVFGDNWRKEGRKQRPVRFLHLLTLAALGIAKPHLLHLLCLQHFLHLLTLATLELAKLHLLTFVKLLLLNLDLKKLLLMYVLAHT